MADTNENPTNEAKGLSQEEMAKRRAEITAYYEEHIPSLQTQLEYETLLRDIEKMRAERLQAQMFVAKTMSGPPEAPGAQGPQMPPKSPEELAKQIKKEVKPVGRTPNQSISKPKRTLKKKEDAVK